MKTIKKIVSIALLIALMISPFVRNWGGGQLFVLPVSAADSGNFGTNDSLSYTFDEGTGVLRIDGTGDMPDWFIPFTTSPWYASRTSITSVTIGNGITNIGNEAFAETALTEITIPNSVTSIGDGAFEECASLTSVVIPDSVTSIGVSAFAGCESLTSVTIGSGVKTIGSLAFYRCTSLTSVTIPDSVTVIGGSAFYRTPLTEVVIPDSVTSIGYGAFEECASLTSVTIGSGVKTIGESAFGSCTSLTSVTFLSFMPPEFEVYEPYFDKYYSIFGDIDDALPDLIITVPYGRKSVYLEAFAYVGIQIDAANIRELPRPPSPPALWIPPVEQEESAEEEPPEVVVIDDTVVQSVERDGVLYAILTAANIAALRSDDGVILLTFEGQEDIRLTISLEAFEVTDILVIVTDFGTLRMSGSVLKSIREKTVTLSIKKT